MHRLSVSEQIVYTFADVGILVGIVFAIAFIFSYGTFFNWVKYPAGRAVMVLSCSYLGVAIIAALARWISTDYFGRAPLRAVVWWGIPVAFAWLLRVLWSKYRQGERSSSDLLPDRKDSLMSVEGPNQKYSAAKAYVGAAAAGIVAALGSFVTAVDDNVVTAGEWATIAIALIVGAGLTGGGVWATTNKPKS